MMRDCGTVRKMCVALALELDEAVGDRQAAELPNEADALA
jgi:hypothetical protein